MRSIRFCLSLVAVCLIFILTGCASMGSRQQTIDKTLVDAQSIGALKGSLTQTICNKAWDYFEEHHEWPDAIYLARHVGLSIYNRDPENNFAVYILDRPYDQLPAPMDPSQTFASYFFDCQPDSGAYVYCRIRYDNRYSDRNLECSIVEGEHAARHSMKLTAEEYLLAFLTEADSAAQCGYSLNEVVNKHALNISKTSPNPTAKQLFYEFAYELLREYYDAIQASAPDQHQIIFHAQSRRLGDYIYEQDWRH